MRTLLLGAAMTAGLLAGPATAQSTSADPNYGAVALEAGFDGDPRVTALQAGGDLDASTLGNGCSGYITDAPDLRLNYTAGELPLIVSVASSADTTLVVNGPDGRWTCDDDGGRAGSNPSVRFERPQSGRYEIWVGTYESGRTQSARLHISEVSSQ